MLNFFVQGQNHVVLILAYYFCSYIYYFDLLKLNSFHLTLLLCFIIYQQLLINPISMLFCLYCLLVIIYYQMIFFYFNLINGLFFLLVNLIMYLLSYLLIPIFRILFSINFLSHLSILDFFDEFLLDHYTFGILHHITLLSL